jgi:hypothetical protein
MTLQALEEVNSPCGWYRVRGQLPSTRGQDHTHTQRHIVKVLDLSATMFYNAPLSNVSPIVPFSNPNAPVSPSNPSPMNYLIVVLFCHGRCHCHPSCSRLLSIVMRSSSLIPRALFLRNSCHFLLLSIIHCCHHLPPLSHSCTLFDCRPVR